MLDPISKALVRLALREDLGRAGDLTTKFFLPPRRTYRARIIAKQTGVLCGTRVVGEVFRQACPSARLRWLKRDGASLRRGETVALLRGPRELLSAERTALNFLQRLSGIATLTRAFVEEARGTRARIYDTRKTAPGWRALAKHAVLRGGGRNHRMGLYDMVLLKDNHLAGWSTEAPERVAARMKAFRRRHPRVPVEIEAKTHAEVEKALSLGADLVLLDNMPPATLRREIAFIRSRTSRVAVEVSGGVDLSSVRRLARLGPDRISVGKLTHSAPSLDLSLELDA